MDTIIEGSKARPHVCYHPDSLKISIVGWSLMENPQQELDLIHLFIKELSLKNIKPQLEFDLICYNTSSAKAYVNLVRKQVTLLEKIVWKYDDEDEETKEWGEELEILSDTVFEYLPR